VPSSVWSIAFGDYELIVDRKALTYRLTETKIIGAIYLAHPAFAEQADDPVAPIENRTGREPAVIDRPRRRQPAARRRRLVAAARRQAGGVIGWRARGEPRPLLAARQPCRRVAADVLPARGAELRRRSQLNAAV